MASMWDNNDLDTVLCTILSRRPDENMNVYEIARAIEDDFHEVFEAIGRPIGGQGTRDPSLAQYLALHGKRRIDHGYLWGVVHRALEEIPAGTVMAYQKDGTPIRTSVSAPSAFRLVPRAEGAG